MHALRDPTRGGLVASVVEIARAASVGVELDEAKIPVPETVSSACSFLGLDPLQVANEGKMVAFVDPSHSEAVLAAMRARPEGASADGHRPRRRRASRHGRGQDPVRHHPRHRT